jgi:hypothetical protein
MTIDKAGIPQLVVMEPTDQAGQILALTQPQMVIGRSNVADLVLDDHYVSGRQAIVSVDPSVEVTIRDLNSTGGTFVNDERLTGPRVLRAGDLVRFADLVARFEPGGARSAEDTATMPLPQQVTRELPAVTPVGPPEDPGLAGPEAVDAGMYAVTGTVSGTPAVSDLALRLVDKNVGGDVLLANGTTDRGGGFLLSATIPVEVLAARHKAAPDLQVQVMLNGSVAASSAVRYNAPTVIRLDVVIPGGTPGLASEYEALTADLAAFYPGSLAGLEENNGRQDVTYLAGKSGWDARAVAMASMAAQLCQAQPTAEIHPAFYYALFRAGLAADPATLYRTQPTSLERVWAQSISQGVIPRSLQDQIPAAVRGFTSVRAASVITAPPVVGVSTLGDLLKVTFGEDAESHRRFADLYAAYRGDPAEMWAQVDQAFGAQTGARLRLTGQLAYLTVNNGPLISALFQAAGDNPITAAPDLVAHGYHKAESWLPLISQTIVPTQIPGSDAEEKAANYADLLAAQVRLSFPTAVMGQLVHDGTVPVLGGADLQAAVAGFLTASHADFDIGGEPIVRYLARTKVKSGLDQAAIDQITRVQRVYQMTQNSQALARLLGAGIDSAYAVTRHTQAAFRTAFADTVGGEDAANAIYTQARTIHASTLSLTLGYLGARLAPALGSKSTGLIIDPLAGHAAANGAASARVGPPDPPLPIFAQATLEELFGSLDYSACDDCQSITGPAAYLVDLLDFIDITTPALGFQNPQAVLLGRRPDIAALPLTCDNTNIGLPYIDLTNETLEYYVANALSLADYQGHNTDGSLSSGELNAEPQFDDTTTASSAYGSLKSAWGPAPLPFDRSLEQLRMLMSSLGLNLDDLMTRLRDNDSLELGTAAPGGGTTVYGWRDILAERLGLSRPEYQLLTDSGTVSIGDLYGFPAGTTDAAAVTALSRLQECSRRAGVSYTDLASILLTTFVNPGAALIPLVQALTVSFATLEQIHQGTLTTPVRALLPTGLDTAPYGGDVVVWINGNFDQIMQLIVIDVAGAPSDTSKMSLAYANPTTPPTPLTPFDFLRIARFIRLWRKLGLSIEQTDTVITALCPPPGTGSTPAQDLDQRFLQMLPRAGFAFEAMTLLGLDMQADLPGLLACWAPIGATGPDSLYSRMFLTPAMLRADPVFQPVLPDTQPASGPRLLDHQGALCAAFNLTGAEFSLIIADLGYDASTPLTLPAISEVYRRGWLARALSTSVRELLLLMRCTGLNPFAGPPDPAATAPVEPPLILVARLVQALASAALHPSQALYLLWNWDLSGTAAPAESVITGLAGAQRRAFAAVDSQFTVKDDPSGTFARSLMTQVTGTAAADFFFGLLTGAVVTSVSYTAPTGALPQAVADAGGGLLSYDDYAKQLSFAGLLAPAIEASLVTAAGTDATLVAAINSLAAANSAATAPFFATYSDLDLQGLCTTFVTSVLPLPQRYDILLAGLVGGLATRRKQQQALAAVTSAAGADPSFAPALLDDATVMHSADGGSAAIADFTAIETTGLDVTYSGNDPGKPVPRFATLAYGTGNPLPSPAPGTTTIGATWTGYLCAPQDGDYNIQITADPGATVTLSLGGASVALLQSGNTWKNGGVLPLTGGALTPVTITATGLSATFAVTWETQGSGWQPIPAAALFPATLVASLGVTYVRFLKITTLASALTLTAADIGYLVTGTGLNVSGGLWTDVLPTAGQPGPAVSAEFANVLDAILGYAQLKARYSPGTQAPAAGRLLSVLQQMTAATPDPAPALLALTGWDQVSLGALLEHLYGTGSLGGIAAAPLAVLRRLCDAFTVAISSGITADTLIHATTNDPDSAGTTTVEDFEAAVRSRFAEPDWLAAVKPVYDALRIQQRDALVAYILVQAGPAILAALGIEATDTRPCTADDLFGYFLFDTQMQPCMETSRIRHALSSVQLFIERALRNIEPLVSPADIDAGQWTWRNRYRVWQANREVFLWPENWLDEGLRDDQSPICQTMLKQLLQSDITDDTAAAAYLDYLSDLEQVAKLEPCGMCYVDPGDGTSNYTMHVVARSSGAHRRHYYRRFANGTWGAWAEIPLKIEGVPLIPYVWNGRLMLFWLQIQHSPGVAASTLTGYLPPASDVSTGIGPVAQEVGSTAANSQALSSIGAVLCYSEYYNGKWQPAKTSDHDNPLIMVDFADYSLFDRSQFMLWPWMSQDPSDDALYIELQWAGTEPRASTGISAGVGNGFAVYNTHSAPVPWGQLTTEVTFATPQYVRLLASTTPTSDPPDIVVAGYGTFDPSNPGGNPFTGGFGLLAGTLPLSIIEAQPDVTDQWNIPFFFSDARNAFYVTTTATQISAAEFTGLMMGDAPAVDSEGAISGIAELATPSRPAVATAEIGTPSGAQRVLGLSPGLRWVLAEGNTVQFNGSRIGFAGSEATGSEETPS